MSHWFGPHLPAAHPDKLTRAPSGFTPHYLQIQRHGNGSGAVRQGRRAGVISQAGGVLNVRIRQIPRHAPQVGRSHGCNRSNAEDNPPFSEAMKGTRAVSAAGPRRPFQRALAAWGRTYQLRSVRGRPRPMTILPPDAANRSCRMVRGRGRRSIARKISGVAASDAPPPPGAARCLPPSCLRRLRDGDLHRVIGVGAPWGRLGFSLAPEHPQSHPRAWRCSSTGGGGKPHHSAHRVDSSEVRAGTAWSKTRCASVLTGSCAACSTSAV